MTEKNIDKLEKQLIKLGFEDAVPWIRDYRTINDPKFSIPYWQTKDNDQLRYSLNYYRNEHQYVELKDYSLTIRTIPVSPEHTAMDKRLQQADDLINEGLNRKLAADELDFCKQVDRELKDLYKTDKEAAEKFMFKYWPQTVYKEYIPDDQALKEKFETSMSVMVGDLPGLDAEQAYQQLKDISNNPPDTHLGQSNLVALSKNSGQSKLEISTDHIVEVVKTMQSGLREDYLWFGFKDTGNTLRSDEIIFFESAADAKLFVAKNARDGEVYKVLPMEATNVMIMDHVFLDAEEGNLLSAVRINFHEIENKQEEIDFNRSVHMMETTMNHQHWKDMSPEVFGGFLLQLQDFSMQSDAGKNAITKLVNDNWPDLLNEKIYLLTNNQNVSTMNETNLKYLKDDLKFHGFGEKLFGELEANMKKVEKEFTLSISTQMQKDKISAVLYFRKGNDSDMYFFNKFDAKLEKEAMAPRENTFYLDKSKGFTMKEAYNYLDGRAVFKEFTNLEKEQYKAWRQIDPDYKDKNNNFEFKQYSERYGYDLREALSYYPIREFVKADDSLNLVKSLERGNLHTVTMDRDGEKLQFQVAADPKGRSIAIYEMDGRQLTKTEKEELMLAPEIREQRIEQRNNPDGAKEKTNAPAIENNHQAAAEKTNVKEEKQSNDKGKDKAKDKSLLPKAKGNGLLEKKRTNSKKSLGV